jgi:hypothetical protein
MLRDGGGMTRMVTVPFAKASLTAAAAFCALASGTVHAADGSGDVSDLILNLSRYTSWPASPTRKRLTVCYAHGGAMTTNALVTDQNGCPFAGSRCSGVKSPRRHKSPVAWCSGSMPTYVRRRATGWRLRLIS